MALRLLASRRAESSSPSAGRKSLTKTKPSAAALAVELGRDEEFLRALRVVRKWDLETE